jgi:hypothetical protein
MAVLRVQMAALGAGGWARLVAQSFGLGNDRLGRKVDDSVIVRQARFVNRNSRITD